MGEEGVIKAIDRASVQKICAGQVILDLAGVAKELIENSLDAGATSIEIRLKDDGASLVEVSDNGSGIDPANYQLLMKQHCTSKLQRFEDLQGIQTMGFRGEALTSLAVLATVTITTRTDKQDLASKLVYEHQTGALLSCSPVARERGTTVSVTDMFKSMPVRAKDFQKNIKREYGKLQWLVQSYAVNCTDVRIALFNQPRGKTVRQLVLGTQAGSSLRNNIATLFGPAQVQNLLWFDERFTQPTGLAVSGCISGPESSRRDAAHQFFFLNRRPIDYPKLGKLMNEAYRLAVTAAHASPFFIVNISLPTDVYDMNLTPDKRKILFHDEGPLVARMKELLAQLFERAQSSRSLSGGLSSPFTAPRRPAAVPHIQLPAVSPASPPPPQQAQPPPAAPAELAAVPPSADLRSELAAQQVVHAYDAGAAHSGSLSKASGPVGGIGRSTSTPAAPVGVGSRLLAAVKAVKAQGSTPAGSAAPPSQTTEATPHPLGRRLSGPGAGVGSGRLPLDALSVALLARRPRWAEPAAVAAVSAAAPAVADPGAAASPSATPGPAAAPAGGLEAGPMEDDSNRPYVPPAEEGVLSFSWESLLPSTALNVKKRKLSDEIAKANDTSDDPEPAAADCAPVAIGRPGGFEVGVEGSAREKLAELNRLFTKEDFLSVEVVGQFNLGFVVGRLRGDLFIFDQHASDEKASYEELRRSVVLKTQALLKPISLELTALERHTVEQHADVFAANGFQLRQQERVDSPPLVELLSYPFSKASSFGLEDFKELIGMLQEAPPASGVLLRPYRVNALLMSRACRKSIMIGDALNAEQMSRLVRGLARLDHPWQCPHGRPTMNFLASIERLSRSRWSRSFALPPGTSS